VRMKILVAVALCLLACSPAQSALAPSASTTPAGTPTPAPTATASVTPTAAATARPSATAAPAASTTAPATTAPGTAQRCAPLSGGDRSANRVLLDVRAARQQQGYDRVVFDFGPGALPPYAVEQVDRVIQGGSGFVKPVEGTALFVVRFIQAGGMGEYRGPTQVRPDTQNVREVVLSTNFEGVLEFGVGLARHSCPRVSVLASPARLVLDFD
jgi:hypothetical protein